MPQQRTRPYTADVSDLVVEESAGVPVDELTVEEPDTAGALSALSGARTIAPPTSLTSRVIRNLPIVGGAVGGLMGGGRTNPLGIVTAGAGGGVGQIVADAANAIRGRSDLVAPTFGERLTGVGVSAVEQGGLEGVGRGLAKPFEPAARWMMNAALRPGIRILDKSGKPITVKNTTARAFKDVDLVEDTLNRVPVSKRGVVRADEGVKASRERTMTRVRQAEIELEQRAGTSSGRRALPEGRGEVALGDTPVPTGGRPAVQFAQATERVPFNAQRSRQGMSPDPAVTQFYGGMPARGADDAVTDMVQGPGTVWLPASEMVGAGGRTAGASGRTVGGVGTAPRANLITVDEALAPAVKHRARLARGGQSPAVIRQWDRRIAEYRTAYQQAVPLTAGQARKDALADQAADLYARDPTGRAPQEAKFLQLLADGYRRAIEQRVPGIRGMNAETQRWLGVRTAVLNALNRESRSDRFTISGAIATPQLLGAAARGTRRAGRAVQQSPQAARGIGMLISPDEKEP